VRKQTVSQADWDHEQRQARNEPCLQIGSGIPQGEHRRDGKEETGKTDPKGPGDVTKTLPLLSLRLGRRRSKRGNYCEDANRLNGTKRRRVVERPRIHEHNEDADF